MKSEVLGPEWDSDLRAMAAIPVPGPVTLSYRREPDYFAGVRIQGNRVAVLGTTEGKDLVQAVTRAVKRSFVDGVEQELGYLGGLRVKERYRGKMFLGNGCAYLKAHHESDPVDGYLCTFVRAREEAFRSLTRARRILPSNIPWGEYHTYAIFLRNHSSCVPAHPSAAGPPRQGLPHSLELRTGAQVDPAEACAFLRSVLRRKQFAPTYYPEDFSTGYLSRFNSSGWIGVWRKGVLLGVAARWSQKDCKQTVVVSYPGALAWARSFLNAALSLSGYRLLPRPGEELASSCLAFVGALDDDPRVFRVLLDTAARMASEAGDHFLLAGFHERDPLERVARRRLHMRYDSALYVAAWSDTEAAVRSWGRAAVPYLELGTL